VFVHILELEHKTAALKETERVLKEGGIFILNHPMSKAFGFDEYRVEEYCSFLTLHEFISLITENTNFEITDIKPTYYHFRRTRMPFALTRLTRGLISLPFAPDMLLATDYVHARILPLEQSDTVYVRLQKPTRPG